MSNRLFWYVGERNPSITDTAEINGAAQDLSGKTCKFKMRAIGASADDLKVDASVSNTPGADGVLRYDWGATDTDTAGEYLVWWTVTTSGKEQSISESVIEIREHGPVPNGYVELESLKATANLSGYSYADGDLRLAIAAASRAVDAECGRRFYLDSDATSVRYFSPVSGRAVLIDDISTVTSVQVDLSGTGTYTTWTAGTEFNVAPYNAALDSEPYTALEAYRGYSFPCYPKAVKVTGKFGWPAVPAPVVECTTIYASRLAKRAREAPFGIQAVGLDGASARLSRTDPDLMFLLSRYVRRTLAL